MINDLILSFVFTFLQYFHFFHIIFIVSVISNEFINVIIIIVCCIHLTVVKVFIALKWCFVSFYHCLFVYCIYYSLVFSPFHLFIFLNNCLNVE